MIILLGCGEGHHDPERVHVPRLHRLQRPASRCQRRPLERVHQLGSLLDRKPTRHRPHPQQRHPWHRYQPLPTGLFSHP